MIFSKVVPEKDLLYDIKYFKGMIIGESAGWCLQFKRSFITAKNNYYKYFAFYDGFGILDDPFYVDVDSINQSYYLEKLRKKAKEKKALSAIFDEGAIIYNRKNGETEIFGQVLKIEEN